MLNENRFLGTFRGHNTRTKYVQGQTDCSTSMFVYSVISLKFAGFPNQVL